MVDVPRTSRVRTTYAQLRESPLQYAYGTAGSSRLARLFRKPAGTGLDVVALVVEDSFGCLLFCRLIQANQLINARTL